MKKPTRHLVLRRENIRSLAALELRPVAGGAEVKAMESGGAGCGNDIGGGVLQPKLFD
jgi:hypothetical protein